MFEFDPEQTIEEKIQNINNLNIDPKRKELRIIGAEIKNLSNWGFYYRLSKECDQSEVGGHIQSAKLHLESIQGKYL